MNNQTTFEQYLQYEGATIEEASEMWHNIQNMIADGFSASSALSKYGLPEDLAELF